MASQDKIPVTVLTGFLGSGKTTFVNYLLMANHGQRLAIVENEFGEVSVDDGLVLRTNEEVIEMLNGCICCTVREDLIVALKRLVETKRDKFDAIIIETTGLADPAPIAQTFFVDDDMKRLFMLDAIVTFVDCKHTPAHLDEVKPEGVENEAVEQVAFADVLVLNKTDLVTLDQLAALRAKLKGINNGAKVLEAQHSRVPVKEVLGIRAFDLDRTLAMEADFLDTTAEHKHDNSVSSVGVCIEGEFNYDQFNDWLSTLLKEKGADIFRSKGILALSGTDERFVFQGVHMVLNMGGSQAADNKLPDWAPGEKRLNKLCFIGRNLNRAELVAGLEACIFDGKYPDPGPLPTTKLRFNPGDVVLVNCDTWLPGVVVMHWYREALWETGRYVPYQVELTDGSGSLIWVPGDSNKFIKRLAAPK